MIGKREKSLFLIATPDRLRYARAAAWQGARAIDDCGMAAAQLAGKKDAPPAAQSRPLWRERSRGGKNASAWQGRHYLCRHRVDPYPDDEPASAADAGRDRARCDRRGGGGRGDIASARARPERR